MTFVFHYNFYPKPKGDLEDAEITPEIKQKLTAKNVMILSVSIVATYDLHIWKKMEIDTDPNLPAVAGKPYSGPLKHHKFVKEEIEKNIIGRINSKIHELICHPPS